MIKWLERIVGQRFFGPTSKARHALRIAETLIPAGLIFADAAPLFLLTKEKGVTKNGPPCLCRESMHGFEEGVVCFVSHERKLTKAAGNVEGGPGG